KLDASATAEWCPQANGKFAEWVTAGDLPAGAEDRAAVIENLRGDGAGQSEVVPQVLKPAAEEMFGDAVAVHRRSRCPRDRRNAVLADRHTDGPDLPSGLYCAPAEVGFFKVE